MSAENEMKAAHPDAVNVIIVGMAGSGKTTLMSILEEKTESYLINLDPACNDPPYSPDIDIRDTIDYKKVMKEYNLGPNGAIVTSLNLYSTKVDQLIQVLQTKNQQIFIDTPGQIEVFTWSASGQLITEALAATAPTVYLYVVDTSRCVNSPITFMSNMTYACSILYKTKLPLIIVFTKTDVVSCEKLNEWMNDYDAYMKALDETSSYANELQRSLCLALDEFYSCIQHCGVSSKTGDGIFDLIKMIDNAKDQYYKEYYSEMQKRKQEAKEKEEMRKKESMDKFENDYKGEKGGVDVDSDYCGKAGMRLFGEEDEGIVFRNGQRFFFGKGVDTIDENEEEQNEIDVGEAPCDTYKDNEDMNDI